MELQEKLIRLRKEAGLSQMEVAEELGVSRQAVSRWETGAALPTTDNLICLVGLYGVSLDELVYDASGKNAERSPDQGADTETAVVTKMIRKKLSVGWMVLICVCGIVLLWGALTKSMGAATTLLASVAILLIVGWFMYGTYCAIIYIKNRSGKK